MASGDTTPELGFAKSKVPIFGAFIDYMDTNIEYLRKKTFVNAERLNARASKATLSATFLAFVCLLLGLTCNLKFEVVLVDETPLPYDLHFMLMSKDDTLYIDDIDLSQVMWSLEASDCLVTLISCLLIWNSSNVSSPLSEYLFLPWLGATIRGLFLRQGPTAAALLYTIAVIEGEVNPLFITSFCFLFLLESRLVLEIFRLVRARWEHRLDYAAAVQRDTQYEEDNLLTNDDERSIEVRNYIY